MDARRIAAGSVIAIVAAVGAGVVASLVLQARQVATLAERFGRASDVTRIEGGHFAILASVPDDCRVGVPCEVTLAFVGTAGWEVNPNFPFKFDASNGPPGPTTLLPSRSYARTAFELGPNRATVRLGAEPRLVGRHRLVGTLKASVCHAALERCRIESQPVALEVDVGS